MGNSVRIVQVDDGSFVLEIVYKDESTEMGGCKHRTITAGSECDVLSQLQKMFESGFPFKKTDAFDVVFAEAPEIVPIVSPEETVSEVVVEIDRPIKAVEDTPLEQMAPHVAEKNKNKRMRD